MWISETKYDKMWEEKQELERNKDKLLQLLSSVILHYGKGVVEIPMPPIATRNINWTYNYNEGTLSIRTRIYGLSDGDEDSDK